MNQNQFIFFKRLLYTMFKVKSSFVIQKGFSMLFYLFSHQQINSVNSEKGVMAANVIIVVAFCGKKRLNLYTVVIRSKFVNFENFD